MLQESRRGIFESCPGLSEKLGTIHQQTDYDVNQMMYGPTARVVPSSNKVMTSQVVPASSTIAPIQEATTSRIDNQYINGHQETRSSYQETRSSQLPPGYPVVQATMVNAFVQQKGRSSPQEMYRGNPSQEAYKWLPNHELLIAKDEMIEQKDVIVQKQRTMIFQLKQTNMELETLLNTKDMQIKSRSRIDDRSDIHLREMEYQVREMKIKIDEAKTSRQDEFEKLQRKLGETEYELDRVQKAYKELDGVHAKELKNMGKQLKQHTASLGSQKEEFDSLTEQLKAAKQENVKLQSYLEELPTEDEFQKVKMQLKNARKEKNELSDQLEALETRLREYRNELVQQKEQNEALVKTQTMLQENIGSLEASLVKYKKQDKLGPISLEEHDELKMDRDRVINENRELKESLEKRHKKMKLLHYESLNMKVNICQC